MRKDMEARTENGVSQRSIAVWEIISVLTSGLIAEWIVLSFAGRNKGVMAIPIILALVLMIFSHRERGETAREIGLRGDNFLSALGLLVLPTAIAVITIIAIGWFSNGAILAAPWRNRLLLLPLWALFQQYVLNGFINRRAQLVFGNGLQTSIVVGIIFGILHLPNALLAILTFIGGSVWAIVYQRRPNLFALALSHSLVSLTLALTVPPSLLNHLRVGFKYFG